MSAVDIVNMEEGRSTARKSMIVTSVLAIAAVVLVMLATKTPPSPLFTSHQSELDLGTRSVIVNTAISNPPNIIFILADDMGYSSIGNQDNDLSFVTPQLDVLAQKGIVMKNYYALELCTPSRASLLTGRYPISIGMQFGVVEADLAWGMPLEETTVAEVLREAGYKTHAIGKWHLGHHSPLYLPTARGFDSFTGFMDGENYYFSKRDPMTENKFFDFLTMDEDCFSTYSGGNMHNYSTHLYRDWAVETIQQHDQSSPLFLYLSFQAVHTPFTDDVEDREPSDSFVPPKIYDTIMSDVVGRHRQLYGITLNIMDSAVSDIVIALEESGMYDNTYIIFASDNGGCFKGGGKNGPLRGTKLTMLEGGTKVDAFISSPLLEESIQGSSYQGLFHVSDWFPTVLDLAGLQSASSSSYQPETGYELDGVSHAAMFSSSAYETEGATDAVSYPRQLMLYNSYSHVKEYDFDNKGTGGFAIRNERYKLIHFWNSSDYAGWHQYDALIAGTDDDAPTYIDGNCAIGDVMSGVYTAALFDLVEDPYETTNIYDSDDEDVAAIQAELYSELESVNLKATQDKYSNIISEAAFEAWQAAGNYIVPWVKAGNKVTKKFKTTYPSYCGSSQTRLTGTDSSSI